MNKTRKTADQVYPMLLTAKEMSKVSGIGENTLRRLMEAGELEFLQIGSHRLLCSAAIWDYYERCKTPIRVNPPSELVCVGQAVGT